MHQNIPHLRDFTRYLREISRKYSYCIKNLGNTVIWQHIEKGNSGWWFGIKLVLRLCSYLLSEKEWEFDWRFYVSISGHLQRENTGKRCPTPYTLHPASHTDTAGHTKAFDYPVVQTRLDTPRPLITQSHSHGWTYQGLWLPSRTDTAGHTKAFDYPVVQTRLAIPRPLITQSHRHGWPYQGLWLPSHTDTAGHTKVFDYPVAQTRLDIPRPLIT